MPTTRLGQTLQVNESFHSFDIPFQAFNVISSSMNAVEPLMYQAVNPFCSLR